jgi:hypothetical protein
VLGDGQELPEPARIQHVIRHATSLTRFTCETTPKICFPFVTDGPSVGIDTTSERMRTPR